MTLILLTALLIPFDSAPFAWVDTRLAQGKQPAGDARDLQRIAMEGWTAARAIAPKGGAVELLGPVNLRLKALDAFPGTSARYAEIAIRAAVSAAQEERDELALLLAHARDLSNQMALIGAPAAVPLPIDELEGELWLEVDRFTEARDAYERATQAAASPNAWIGLARSSDKLGDVVTACRAYTTAASTRNLPAPVELEISLYALKCQNLKPEILEALAGHGLRPRADTRLALLREQINDLYRLEIRALRDQCRAGIFPTTELAARVVELRRRYPLLSIPMTEWVMLP